MLVSRILSFTLACLLLLQSMPTLIEVAAFAANRDALTAQHCVNIDAPTLDCRAACYLGSQLSDIGQQLQQDTPSQATDNAAPNNGPSYVLPKGQELSAPLALQNTRTAPVVYQTAWTTRYQDVASPPPLG